MFWDKKKKESMLPDLPSNSRPTLPGYRKLPELPTSSTDRNATNQLPSFPDSPMKSGFSQSAIKDAIAAEEDAASKIKDDDDEEDMEKQYKMVEIKEWSPKTPQMAPPKKIMETKPIYVRLDKFQAAKKTIDEVRSMLADSENLLKKIREVKLREDQELTAWEREMQLMRARLNNVADDIFERMEE